MTDQLKHLGETITQRRKQLQLSQAELAEKSGVNRTFICNIERGKQNPSFCTILTIASALNTSLSKLIREYEKKAKEIPQPEETT